MVYDLRKNIDFRKVPRLCPFVLLVKEVDEFEYGALVE